LRNVSRSRIVSRDPSAIATALSEILETTDRSDGRQKMAEFSAGRIAAELHRMYIEIAARPIWDPAEGPA
jgi:hypothetical protein